jgi:hypothetical protein
VRHRGRYGHPSTYRRAEQQAGRAGWPRILQKPGQVIWWLLLLSAVCEALPNFHPKIRHQHQNRLLSVVMQDLVVIFVYDMLRMLTLLTLSSSLSFCSEETIHVLRYCHESAHP